MSKSFVLGYRNIKKLTMADYAFSLFLISKYAALLYNTVSLYRLGQALGPHDSCWVIMFFVRGEN